MSKRRIRSWEEDRDAGIRSARRNAIDREIREDSGWRSGEVTREERQQIYRDEEIRQDKEDAEDKLREEG